MVRRLVWLALTLAVASAVMTIQELADHTGSALSDLAKSYLGMEHVASEIKPKDFSSSQKNDGRKLVKEMAHTITSKIKTRMHQVISKPPKNQMHFFFYS